MKHYSRYILSALLVTLTVQFVGCGAADISSAKLYRQRRDYVKANDLLEHALKEDPTNDEAWYLYTVNLYDLKNYERISQIIDTASLYSVSHRTEIQGIKHNTWIELYNGGLTAFNTNPDSREQQKAAIGYLESARMLAPDQPETYDMLGQVYLQAGDTAKYIDSYNQELNLMNSSHTQGATMGLMLHTSPQSVERAIGGAPARKQMIPIGGSDTAMIYIYPSKQAYVYFERATKAPKDWQLTGWRIGADEAQGLQPMRISVNAYEQVGNYYYQRGIAALGRNNMSAAKAEFDKAVPVLMTLQRIDPSNEFAFAAIPDIYTRTNQVDKAKQEYERQLAEHPSKAMYVAYGTLMMKNNDFSGAASAFEKALGLDPVYEPALYDLAAVYKNWAAADQKAKTGNFKQELEKSTEYFERLRAVNKTDLTVLQNLAENYDILGKKDKALALIGEFESMKSSDAAGTSDYWNLLGKLYARANRAADSEAAFKKADQLRQQGK